MFNSFFKITITLAALTFVGCSSLQKDFSQAAADDYRSRPQLRQSLVDPTQPLTEPVVQKILSSKVAFPKTINLAVIRLSDSIEGMDFQMIDQEIADKFYNKANWGNRVQSIIPVPQMMIAKPVTLASLRQTAVLLQADALLIIKSVSYSDWKFQWTEKHKAKGITSLEVILLDTRTSVVPFTSMVTETVEITTDDSKDYSNYEWLARAKKESEAKAMLQVLPAVEKFMSKVL